MIRQDITKKKLPDAPGVYYFLNAEKKTMYIGKATQRATHSPDTLPSFHN
jgi:excinuclease UvrABC nuclease subunit